MDTLFAEFVEKSLVMLLPLGIFVLILAAGYVLRRYLLVRLSRWARRTDSPVGDVILSAVRTPFLVLCAMLGIYVALEFSDIPKAFVDRADKGLSILAVFAVALVTANILTGFARIRAERIESVLPVTSLTENIIRIVVYGVGTLVVLHKIGISIVPILATLGVGGLAVALALKDTLSNFFAGFHIVATRQIRVGDYLKLSSAEEGYVNDISWRTTKIRTLSGNLVLVPNAKLTELIVTNYTLPEKDMAVPVDLGVHYDSDLAKVEQVTCEVAAEVMKEVPGGVPEFTPFIRYHTLGAFSIDFSVILRGREFVDQYLIKHEFIKRIHERFAKEGIVIPYPIRALNYEQEKRG
ncbi:MAG: mechanosensitive ion channel family protein [Deltaproteobacteria bacterium]|nr:mechanosensitive ion channel family protein [Deltaproteobacteria bacterium]